MSRLTDSIRDTTMPITASSQYPKAEANSRVDYPGQRRAKQDGNSACVVDTTGLQPILGIVPEAICHFITRTSRNHTG